MTYGERNHRFLIVFMHVICLSIIVMFFSGMYYCKKEQYELNNELTIKINKTIGNIKSKNQVSIQEIQNDLEQLNGQTESSFIVSSKIENVSIIEVSEKDNIYKISYDLNGENNSTNVNFYNIV